MGKTVKSKITAKYQTTVPKTVREELGLGPSDYLQWEVRDGEARVTPASHAFLARRNSVRVGPGSVLDDVRTARRSRGGRAHGRQDGDVRRARPSGAPGQRRKSE